jgi:uncharacterized protein
MQRTAVVSSNLSSVGYDPETQVLEIEFLNGGVYQYYGVPADVYSGLMGAGSKGAYHADFIKDRYPWSRVQ